jgi:hypothetical protein
MGKGRSVYRISVGRPEGKRSLGRPRRRREDNIKMDLADIWIDRSNWMWLAENRVQWQVFVNTIMKVLKNILHHGVS